MRPLGSRGGVGVGGGMAGVGDDPSRCGGAWDGWVGPGKSWVGGGWAVGANANPPRLLGGRRGVGAGGGWERPLAWRGVVAHCIAWACAPGCQKMSNIY
jgi:hypothetical protein